jgi:bifunctional polynucleotide phosphatase/kinase
MTSLNLQLHNKTTLFMVSTMNEKHIRQINDNTFDLTKKIKLASFDFNATLVRTASGNVHPKSAQDWKPMYDEVIPKLQELYKQGFIIVIFSNQKSIMPRNKTASSIDKAKLNKVKITYQFEKFIEASGIPIDVFIATADDANRKPFPTMYQSFLELHSISDSNINKEVSFYCGDAAGRSVSGIDPKKKDFSDSDYKFAGNCRLKFYTPEMLFLPECSEYIPKLPPSNKQIIYLQPLSDVFTPVPIDHQEMLIMVGMPGSGKSHFAKELETNNKKYIRINQDTLKTKAKCISAAKEAIKKKLNPIIDATNRDCKTRAIWIKIANDNNILVRIIWFNTDIITSKYLMHLRMYKCGEVKISSMVYNMYKRDFQKPTITELPLSNPLHIIHMFPNLKFTDKQFHMFL